MYFNHYTNRPVKLAEALVNIDDQHFSKPEDMAGFLDGYRELWEGVAKPPRQSEFAAILALRASLREVMTAEDNASAIATINQLLIAHGAVPRVSMHSGEPHLHFEPPNSTMTSWLGTTTSMGLGAVLVEHGINRFGQCEASNCEDVYVDTSKNRSRRHCSTTCSTREAVAAHRRRKTE
jgi:predicted RNA-binding Zn ribbon-like protein